MQSFPSLKIPVSVLRACVLFTVAMFAVAVFALAVGSAQTSPGNPSCGNANNTSASTRYRAGSSGNATPGNVSKLPLRSLLYSGAETRIYTRYMPWFGDTHHRDVGYRSDDREQVSRQVADMVSRGIQGAIVDWYGPSGLKNQSTMLLMKEAELHNGFEFAISEDAGSIRECQHHGCNPTEKLISDLDYAAQHFEGSPAYLRFEGRPAIFFFGLETFPIDWHRLRRALPLNPLLFFRNSPTFANPDADGAYAWLAPETAAAADPMATQYLERFYSRAQHSDKIAMGSAYKGFNDSEANWGKGRTIDQQCGQTWLTTFAEVGHFYSARHQLPALIIPSWNDYEEGTEVESGIDNCVSVRASIEDGKLLWSISGRDNTVDHFVILAEQSSQWTAVTELSSSSHSIQIRELPLPTDTSAVCVQAVGKASLLNHFSGPIRYSAPGR